MRKWIFGLAIVALLGVFCYSGWQLLDYYTQGAENQAVYDDLAALKPVVSAPSKPVEEAPPLPTEDTAPTEPAIPENCIPVIHPVTGETVWMLPEYQELFAINPDIVGWITMECLGVDYPVVQSQPDNADYYLERNFYGKKSPYGCIYAKEACDVFKPTANITLYGHRMNDGGMFGNLGRYKKESYWRENPTFRFNTLQRTGTYQILAVFQAKAGASGSFQYHQFVDTEDPRVFDQFVASCKSWALFDTGVEAEFGDELLTLSTCDYHTKNGRLVVVAKRIGD